MKKNALQLKVKKTKELMEERARMVKPAEEWRAYRKFLKEWMGLSKNKIIWFFPVAASVSALIVSTIAFLSWLRQTNVWTRNKLHI